MQDVPVMLLRFPGQEEGGSLPSKSGRSYSHEDWQEGHTGRLQASSYSPEGVVDDNVNLTCGLLLQAGAQYSAAEKTRA